VDEQKINKYKIYEIQKRNKHHKSKSKTNGQIERKRDRQRDRHAYNSTGVRRAEHITRQITSETSLSRQSIALVLTYKITTTSENTHENERKTNYNSTRVLYQQRRVNPSIAQICASVGVFFVFFLVFPIIVRKTRKTWEKTPTLAQVWAIDQFTRCCWTFSLEQPTSSATWY